MFFGKTSWNWNDKKFINVTGGNVKRLGKYTAVIRLHRDVAVDLPFEIIAGS